jgi:hypothetical protein
MPKVDVVWVLTGHSESGDDYGPRVFRKKPSQKKLSEIAHNWDGHFGETEGWEDGPGDYGSYVFMTISQQNVE